MYGGAGEYGDFPERPQPSRGMVSLSDYRLRHAQYKTDEDLQAVSAVPDDCGQDDHESTITVTAMVPVTTSR